MATLIKENTMSNEALENGKRHISDMLSDFLYYNRKGDEEFTLNDIKEMMKHPNVIEELTEAFRAELTRVSKHYK